MPSSIEPDLLAIVQELETLLKSVAGGLTPNRAEAVVYSRCRTELLDSVLKDVLPGFAYQCISVYKFKDFITLYDPDLSMRETFIAKAFGQCRAVLADARGEAAKRDTPSPQQWML